MDFSEIKAKSALRQSGAWESGLADLGDIELKVRGFKSATYQQEFAKAARAVVAADRDDKGNIKEDVLKGIIRDTLAAFGLVDWRQLTDGGSAVDFSTEAARAYLDDEVFYASAVQAMDKADEGIAVVEAAVVGNSETP